MGRVFTWDEVASRRIPSADALTRVAAEVRRVLTAHPGVVAGTFCGSVLRRDCTNRSDLDCVVLYQSSQTRSVMSVLQVLTADAAEHFVPLEFIPLATDIAATPLHHLTPSFAGHVVRAVRDGGMIKADPMRLLNLESADNIADYRSYLTFKLRKLEAGLARLSSLNERDRCRLYQKALEAPVHIARKIIGLHTRELPTDSKQSVQQCYLSMRRPPEETAAFLEARRMDLEYSAVLSDALADPDETSYRAALGRLDEAVWTSLGYVRLLVLAEASARP